MKKMFKGVFTLLFLLFLLLFLNKNNNPYENEKILSKEAIDQFEKDIKEGKKIIPSHYMLEKKDYNNKASKWGLECSNLLEKGVNKILRRLLDSIEENEKE